MYDILTQYYGYITEHVDATIDSYPPEVMTIPSSSMYSAMFSTYDGRHYYTCQPLHEVVFSFGCLSYRMIDWLIRLMQDKPFRSFIDVEFEHDGFQLKSRCHYRISHMTRDDRHLRVFIRWEEPEEQGSILMIDMDKAGHTDIREITELQHKANQQLLDALRTIELIREKQNLANIEIDSKEARENLKQLVLVRVASGLYDGKNINLNQYVG